MINRTPQLRSVLSDKRKAQRRARSRLCSGSTEKKGPIIVAYKNVTKACQVLCNADSDLSSVPIQASGQGWDPPVAPGNVNKPVNSNPGLLPSAWSTQKAAKKERTPLPVLIKLDSVHYFKEIRPCWAQQHRPIILALEMWRQEDGSLRLSLAMSI